MVEPSRKAYKKIQEVARLIHEEIESQIKTRPIVITDTQLPESLPEATFADALEYLEKKGLFSFRYERVYSLAYYDHEKKRKEALHYNGFKQDETWLDKIEEAKTYARKQEIEKSRGHSSTFTIQPQPNFSEKYNMIMSKYNGEARYKVYIGGNNNSSLFINNYRINSFNAAWRQKIFEHALSQDNGTLVDAKLYMPKTVASKKTRGMPQIMPEVIKSSFLRQVFFRDIKMTTFRMYHTITNDMVDDGFCDTTLVDKELEKMYGKQKIA